jgi:hypothetical protein
MQELGLEIQKDPAKAMDESTGKKMEALKDKFVELGCTGR